MKYTTEQFISPCGCRSAGECTHNMFAGTDALSALIGGFSVALKEKLHRKMLEGKSGWDDPAWPRENILMQLRSHIDKGDMLDVAAFAMFAWNQEP